MRFEFSSIHHFFTYRAGNWHIIWVHLPGVINSTGDTDKHPLSTAYKDICKAFGLQFYKADNDSRKIALILVASLVLF